MAATARIELRVEPEFKESIEYAAKLTKQSSSDFIRKAVEDGIWQALEDNERVTRVSPTEFEELLAWLDEPAQPNEALAETLRSHRELFDEPGAHW
jgi:uncharacterized protein (DUF1778 family)